MTGYQGYDPSVHKSLKDFEDDCKQKGHYPYFDRYHDPTEEYRDKSAMRAQLREGDPYTVVDPDGTVHHTTIPFED